jgi:hypothetical protein
MRALEVVMHVLVTVPSETTADVDAQLHAAGHIVRHCSEDGAHAVCVALRGRPCPLDRDPIDVVVEVRPHHERPHQAIAGLSDGMRCASRRGIPTIIASGGDVAEAAEAARATPSPRRSSVATEALVDSLKRQGVSSEHAALARAKVTRRWGGMFVQVQAPESVDTSGFGQAAIRIHQELRSVDPWARSVDIAREPPEGLSADRG